MMTWDVCLEYANGNHTILKTYRHRETALKHIDFIYAKYGYPMHVAYRVRPSHSPSALDLGVPA